MNKARWGLPNAQYGIASSGRCYHVLVPVEGREQTWTPLCYSGEINAPYGGGQVLCELIPHEAGISLCEKCANFLHADAPPLEHFNKQEVA
jgi:hypothetical protein